MMTVGVMVTVMVVMVCTGHTLLSTTEDTDPMWLDDVRERFGYVV